MPTPHEKTHFIFIPQSHIVPLFTADQRAHRLSVYNAIGSTEFIGSMGGIFPVMKLTRGHRAFQFSVASTLYTTLVRKLHGGTLLNTDFFVDLFFDFRLSEKFQIRAASGHTSQHLSDDVVHQYLAINYVRDYFQLFGIYQLPRYRLMTYAGFILNHNLKTTFNNIPSDLSGTPAYQLGFEHSPFLLGKQGSVFWAADIKFRSETDYTTTQNIQAGVKFMNATQRTIRIAANYASGGDERGQFFKSNRSFFFAGFTFDF